MIVAALACTLYCCGGGNGDSGSDNSDGDTEQNTLTTSYSLAGQTFAVNWVGVEAKYESQMIKVSIAAEPNYDCNQLNAECMQFWFSTSQITTPASYIIYDAWGESPLKVWFWPDLYDQEGLSFHSTGGTLYLTAFGTAAGDHITGSLAATMESEPIVDSNPETGNVQATFDCIVGQSNTL